MKTLKSETSVRDFWNERATLGETAGTQDLILKQLEHRAILAEVERLQPKRILEVGCGRGELAREILSSCLWVEQYDACDNSDGMIAEAQKEWRPRHLDYHICELGNLPAGPYDCIITERMLINLPDDVAQRRAIAKFAGFLAPGGRYLMCENHQASLDFLNGHRASVGLPAIQAPWHNHYLRLGGGRELETWDRSPACNLPNLLVEDMHEFSAPYYFLSRVVNAKVAQEAGQQPDYNSPINRMALSLSPYCVDPRFAIGQLWIWRKA
jgi:SAM-dependent methyltransferase